MELPCNTYLVVDKPAKDINTITKLLILFKNFKVAYQCL